MLNVNESATAIDTTAPESQRTTSVAITPDGRYAVSCNTDANTVSVVDLVTRARVAHLSVADRPVIADQVSRVLVGQRASPELIREAAEASAASADIDPASDIHASSRYRRRLAAVLIRRVLERAFHSLESA